MPLLTVGDLITEAAVMAGMHDPRDGSLPPEESAYGFNKLNQMVDEFATERLEIYREQRVGPFNIVANTQSYRIGSGATWNTARPLWIDRAGVLVDGGATNPVELPVKVLTTKEWSQVTVKSTTSSLPRQLFYDRDFDANSDGLIYLYPIPNVSTPDIVLYVPVAVAEFALDSDNNPIYTTTVVLPPGYRSMLISNLAVIMSLGVITVSDDLRERATTSKAKVAASNVVTHMDALGCDTAVVNSDRRGAPFDWISGGFE